MDRATKIEDILEVCIRNLETGSKSVAECLEEFPEFRDDLARLLPVTLRLRHASSLRTPEAFRQVAGIRMQNLIAARSSESMIQKPVADSRPTSLWDLLPRLRVPAFGLTLIILLLVTLLTSGIVYASSSALPGEALYPTKRTIEDIQLAFTMSAYRESRLHLSLASRRLGEAQALISTDVTAQVDTLLSEYSDQVTQALMLFSVDNSIPPERRASLAEWITLVLTHNEVQLSDLIQRLQLNRDALQNALSTARAGRLLIWNVVQNNPQDFPNFPSNIFLEPSLDPQSDTFTPAAGWTEVSTPFADHRTAVPAAWGTMDPTSLYETYAPFLGTPVPGGWPTDPAIGPLLTQWATAWPTGWPTQLPTALPTGRVNPTDIRDLRKTPIPGVPTRVAPTELPR